SDVSSCSYMCLLLSVFLKGFQWFISNDQDDSGRRPPPNWRWAGRPGGRSPPSRYRAGHRPLGPSWTSSPPESCVVRTSGPPAHSPVHEAVGDGRTWHQKQEEPLLAKRLLDGSRPCGCLIIPSRVPPELPWRSMQEHPCY